MHQAVLASAAASASITRLKVMMSAAPPPSAAGMQHPQDAGLVDRGDDVVGDAPLALGAVGRRPR